MKTSKTMMFQRIICTAMCVVMALGSTVSVNAASPVILEGNYAIETCIGGSYRDSFVVNTAYAQRDGAEMILDYWSAEAHEVHTLTLVSSNDIYRISPAHAPELALNGNKSVNGQVTLSNYDGSNSMKWKAVKVADDSWTFQNMETKLFLTVEGGSAKLASKIIVATDHNGNEDQTFRLFRAEPGRLLADGVYLIMAPQSGNCANVQYAPETEIGQLVLDGADYQKNELFILRYHPEHNAYTLSPLYRPTTGINCLFGSAAAVGSQAVIHPNTEGDTACLWRLSRCGTNYRFQNLASKYYLDIAHGQVNTIGCPINVWTDDFKNQCFTMKFVSEDPGTEIYERGGTTDVTSSWSWPVNGYTVTQSFNHYSSSMASKGRPYHSGIDLVATNKTVNAAASGTVVYKGYSNGNGNHVIISHNLNGETVKTLYSHLANFDRCPAVGQSISQGQAIGIMGTTGNSTGTHLHFAVFQGQSNDPYGYVSSKGADKMNYGGCVFYDPSYVISNGKLP